MEKAGRGEDRVGRKFPPISVMLPEYNLTSSDTIDLDFDDLRYHDLEDHK